MSSCTQQLGVAIMPSHLQPTAWNRWQPLGAATRVETGVKLIIEPLGSRKFEGEDRTLGAQFGVISLVVFEPVSDATMADPSLRGPFSLKFCPQDPPLAMFKRSRYSPDNESKGLSIDEGTGQTLQGYRYVNTLHSVIAHLLKAVLKGRGFKSIFFCNISLLESHQGSPEIQWI